MAAPNRKRVLLLGGLVALASAWLVFQERYLLAPSPAVQAMLRSEDLILSLTPPLHALDKGLLNLELPDLGKARDLFADEVSVRELDPAGAPETTGEAASIAARTVRWPIAKEDRRVPARDLRLWRPLLERVRWIEHCTFKFVRGRFPDLAREDLWETLVQFSGVARTREGRFISVKAMQLLEWRPRAAADLAEGDEAGERPAWEIVSWRQEKLETIEAERPLFVDVLERALPGGAVVARARGSRQDEIAARVLRGEAGFAPPRGFAVINERHPGATVVDIDADGADDLFLLPRWEPAMLLRNRGDGTFEEVAAEMGLALDGDFMTALFADFDNDGDLDLFAASQAEIRYLENEGGRFLDRTATHVSGERPYYAISLSAADYDLDGLLDVYVSTARLSYQMSRAEDRAADPAAAKIAEEIARLDAENPKNAIYNKFGPPNILYRNVGGGRFAFAADVPELYVWRRTIQSTWCDYDHDGDPDVYLANDFAPGNLFRNEGNGRFEDVTAETDTADVGFGMGVTFGDYDFDGRLDLYKTNMYSKAGLRITNQVPGLDPRFNLMAHGNSLFRNLGARWEKTSGLEAPAMLVEAAGWGWSGQFQDLDNDADLDIHALNGFYTAPKEVAIELDC